MHCYSLYGYFIFWSNYWLSSEYYMYIVIRYKNITLLCAYVCNDISNKCIPTCHYFLHYEMSFSGQFSHTSYFLVRLICKDSNHNINPCHASYILGKMWVNFIIINSVTTFVIEIGPRRILEKHPLYHTANIMKLQWSLLSPREQ